MSGRAGKGHQAWHRASRKAADRAALRSWGTLGLFFSTQAGYVFIVPLLEFVAQWESAPPD